MSFAQILDLAINMTENEIFRLTRDVTFQVVTARYLCLVALFENQTKRSNRWGCLFKELSTKDLTLSSVSADLTVEQTLKLSGCSDLLLSQNAKAIYQTR